MSQKLASIELIKEILPINGADKIELAKCLGYQSIVKKGDYKIGDKVIFIQPDCVLPIAPWSEFYKAKSNRTKAIRLKKVWSEGIIEAFNNLGLDSNLEVGAEVSEILNIKHWEPPQPQDLSAKGLLPFNIPKTHEERFQNLDNIPYSELVDISLKIDGQSNSFYCKINEDKTISKGVLGRTMEYKLECSNNYTKNAENYDILNKLEKYCIENNVSLCLRGESYGAGIQKLNNNPHCNKPLSFAAFSIYLIDEKRYAGKNDKFYFRNVCNELDIPTVDILEENVILTPELIYKYSEGINTINGLPFEGVVIKGKDFTFKIINKEYDSKK